MKKNIRLIMILLGIMLLAICIFNVNTVKATAEDEGEYKIEKDGYILYNSFFNTSDVNIKIKDINGDVFVYIDKYKIEQDTLNSIVKEMNKASSNKLLVPISDDVTEIKLKNDTTGEWEADNDKVKISSINDKKYAEIQYYTNDVELDDGAGDENNFWHILKGYSFQLQTDNGESTNEKTIGVEISLMSTNYFEYTARVVSENGVLYGETGGTNGIINGTGLASIPGNLDFSNAYIEYLMSDYVGENIQVDTIGTIPYVGKYGKCFKYKTNLKDAKVNEYKILFVNFDYKEVRSYGDFQLDDNYVIDNEITYKSQTQGNTDTKLKFDLAGNINGTVKAEEIAKDDFIYSKVENELKRYTPKNVYMCISNIYIEDGSFEGSLKLTFEVGEQYNGKTYCVTHMKNWYYEFEEFEGIVKNGKIEITVDSLSPFGIVIADSNEEISNTVNNNKLDETPKTGSYDISLVIYSLIATISFVGIITLKKKQ